MRVRVELSSGPLIEFSDFCHAIAQAICPADEQPLEGMRCVVGRRTRRSFTVRRLPDGNGQPPAGEFQVGPISDGALFHSQSILEPWCPDGEGAVESPVDASQDQVREAWLPFALSDSDRCWLEGVLPQLPPLRYPISDEEAAAFLTAYRDLKERPEWEPMLMTTAEMERRRDGQAAVLARQREALQAEFKRGNIAAVDSMYVPVPVLTTGSYIPREQAVAYLDRCGLVPEGNDAETEAQFPRQETESGQKATSAAMPEVEQAQGDTEPLHTTPKLTEKPVVSKAGELREPKSRGGAGYLAESLPAAERRQIGKVARLPRVMELTGLGRSSIYNRMDSRSAQFDPSFPRSFPLGAQNGGAVGWDEEQVKAWVAKYAAND